MKATILGAALAGFAAFVGLMPEQAQAQDKSILMSLWRGNTDYEAAFKARLTELGIKVNYTEIDAGQDRNKAATLLRNLQSDIAAKKFDLVYSHGTVDSQVAKAVVDNAVPVIFNVSFDPKGAKLVNSLGEPGGTVTGVTNGVPLDDQFKAFMTLKPIKSLALFFNPREPNSNAIEQAVKEWASKNNVTFTSRRVAPDGDGLAQALEEIKSGKLAIDTVYAGADSYVSTKAREIDAAIGDKVNLYGGTETFVLAGWLAAYAPKAEDMGIAAADLAAKIMSGQSPAKTAVVLPQCHLFVSQSAAAKRALPVPADVVLKK